MSKQLMEWDDLPRMSPKNRLMQNLWNLVEATFLPSDFWCDTHNAWTGKCDAPEGAEHDRVNIYRRSPNSSRPTAWSDIPVEYDADVGGSFPE